MQVIRKGGRSLVANDRSGKRKRKRKPRVRRGGARRTPNRMQVYGGALNQLRKDIAQMYQFINTETKYVDISASAAVTAGAWNFVILNTMVQGTTASTRLGQSIRSHGLELRCSVLINAASLVPQGFRVVVFIDKQPNQANAVLTTIYPTGLLTPRTVSYVDRYSILFERTFTFSPNDNGMMLFDYIAKQTWHTEYETSNVGTVADITKNALYLMWYSDQGANTPTFAYNSRYLFFDN